MKKTFVAVAVLAVALGSWSASAFAATVGPEDQAWWSEAQQAPSPAPTVPINQASGTTLMVGNDPSGPNAIAAVRYNVPGTIDGEPVDASTASGTLTLKVADNGAVGTPVVEACPVISSWQSAQGGEWPSRPKYNCATAAKAAFNADTTAATFSLAPGLQARPGVFDLAIVPDPANQTPFSVQFTAPGGDSMTVRPAGAPAPSDASGASAAPSTDTGTRPSFDAGTPADLTAPVPGLSVTPEGTPLATETTAGAGGAGANVASAPTVALASPIRRISDKRGQRALGLALLVLLGLSLWWFGGQPVRNPRLLGSLGADAAPDEPTFVSSGGIGRFARPRAERPPRL